jgi:carboxyl-terminal processing protease
MMKRLFFLFTFLLLIVRLFAQTSEVSLRDIHRYMDTIFEEHVTQKKMSDAVMARAIVIFIDQFDPSRTYLLNSEVTPFVNLSREKLQELVADYEAENFSFFEKMNSLFQNSIRRARSFRSRIDFKNYDDVERSRANLTANLSVVTPFAQTLEELYERIQIIVAEFLLRKQKENIEFRDAMRQVEEEIEVKENEYLYVDRQGAPLSFRDKEELLASHILKAFTASLDAHSSFYNPGEANVLKMTLQKSFEGIGIGFEARGKSLVISQILKDSPAEKSGLIKLNDELLGIDGELITKMDMEKVMEKLQGKAGTAVTLMLKRENNDLGIPQVIQVTLNRQKIEIKEGRVETSFEEYDGGIIGKITLHAFYDGTGAVSSVQDMRKALAELAQKGKIIGLILDLRDNHGGFLMQAVEVAGLFIKTGVVVIAKTSDGKEHFYRDVDPAKLYSGPLVILTSKETASAAEIVAEALKDYGVAIIVGDSHTYGKGSIQMQTITGEQADSSFKVTVGRYYSVSGQSIQDKGVQADLVVPSVYFNKKIGEEYLNFPLSNDSVPPAFEDSLTDIDPDMKEWYLHYYLPNQEKRTDAYRQFIPELQKLSEERLQDNTEYQRFLNGLPLQATQTEDGRQEMVTLPPDEADKQISELQMDEAVNIVKDLIDMVQKSEQNEEPNTPQDEGSLQNS